MLHVVHALSIAVHYLHAVTTDVSHVTASLDCPKLTITCHLLPGSLAQGCYVSLLPYSLGSLEHQEPIIEMIPRNNTSLEARAVLTLSQQTCCYQLLVYDWEANSSVGHIPVPLQTSSIELELSCDLASDKTSNDSGNSNSNNVLQWSFLKYVFSSPPPLPSLPSSRPSLSPLSPSYSQVIPTRCWCQSWLEW